MKCPNCGRENPGIRLFCSRCGELLPDSEARVPEPAVQEPDDDIKIYRKARKPEPKPAANEPKDAPVPVPDDDAFDGETDFFTRRERVRRLYEEDWPELTQKAEPRVRERIFDGRADEKPKDGDSPYARPSEDVRRPPTLTRKNRLQTGRPSTLVPKRDVTPDPENLFSVRGETPFDEDDFDRAPRAPKKPIRRASPYEEPESQSFLMRHVRGIVGMILLAVTVTIVLTWAFTPGAQLVLARLDLAWSASAYASLGNEAYDAGRYGEAGRYFGVALTKDADNANYAVYAANSYIQGGETAKAISALKKLIALQPGNADYYNTLMGLYGGYENMPEDAKALVNEGYERTGDERLKQ